MSANMGEKAQTEARAQAPSSSGLSPIAEGILGRMHPQHAKVFKAIAEAQEDRRGGWRVRRIEMPQAWVITAFRDGLFRAALAKLFNAPFGYKCINASGKMGTYEVYARVSA